MLVNKVLIFAERMLPSTQTFIPIQVEALRIFTPQYVGLIPAVPCFPLRARPILLTRSRNFPARVRRELYRWTGVAPRFHQQIRDTEPVLLHAHFAEAAASAVSIAQAVDVPLILHLRGGAEMMSDRVLKKKLYLYPYLLWRRSLWKRASLFLCVSEFIRKQASEAGFPEEKLRVHYTGIDFNIFRNSDPPPHRDPNLVLYVGRLVEYKGAAHLLRAMQIVRETHPAAHLLIIGDGEFRAIAAALAEELSVPCEFMGEQPTSVVRHWMERARVFCAPSMQVPGGMSEAFGNVFTEAQAMGLPVVSYRHGGVTETMLDGRTGLLAVERDYRELATHIVRYLKDDSFWESSRRIGVEWVRANFDVVAQTRKLETIYREVIAHSSAEKTKRNSFSHNSI